MKGVVEVTEVERAELVVVALPWLWAVLGTAMVLLVFTAGVLVGRGWRRVERVLQDDVADVELAKRDVAARQRHTEVMAVADAALAETAVVAPVSVSDLPPRDEGLDDLNTFLREELADPGFRRAYVEEAARSARERAEYDATMLLGDLDRVGADLAAVVSLDEAHDAYAELDDGEDLPEDPQRVTGVGDRTEPAVGETAAPTMSLPVAGRYVWQQPTPVPPLYGVYPRDCLRGLSLPGRGLLGRLDRVQSLLTQLRVWAARVFRRSAHARHLWTRGRIAAEELTAQLYAERLHRFARFREPMRRMRQTVLPTMPSLGCQP